MPRVVRCNCIRESVAVDQSDNTQKQVPFEPFIGIAPRKYIDLFTMLRRKRDGKVLEFEKANAEQRYSASPSAYTAAEKVLVGALQTAIEKKQLKIEQQEFTYDQSRNSQANP